MCGAHPHAAGARDLGGLRPGLPHRLCSGDPRICDGRALNTHGGEDRG